MTIATDTGLASQTVSIPAGVTLTGDLTIPPNASGIVVFAHGSGSSRASPRNQMVAARLHDAGLATLLFDLLTPGEESVDNRTGQFRFDVSLLADRLVRVTDWLGAQAVTQMLQVGYFGASTGAADRKSVV